MLFPVIYAIYPNGIDEFHLSYVGYPVCGLRPR